MRKTAFPVMFLLVVGLFALAEAPAGAAPAGTVPGLVYYSRVLQGPTNGTVWRMRGDGSLDEQVTVGELPKMSRDGRYLAFHRDNPNFARANIYVRDMQTGVENRIFAHGDYAVYFDWRPNASSLVFDYFCSIYEINRDGSGFRNLLAGANCYDDAPSVSPDGTLIAFHNVNQGIGVFNSNGSGRRILPTGTNVVWPSWAPDGQWIAYVQGPNLFKIRPDGTGKTQLTTFSGANTVFGGTTWTKDGTRILVAGTIDGVRAIHAVAPVGGAVVRLTTSAGTAVDWVGSQLDFAPSAQSLSASTQEDSPVDITLQGSDPEGFGVTFEIVSGPAGGTLGPVAGNTVTYRPGADFIGSDSFTYRSSDGSLYSNEATVTMTVDPVNDAPVAIAQDIGTEEETALAVTLSATDVDGDTLTFAVASAPTSGVLGGDPPNLTYTPGADFNGMDSFTFTASDGQLVSDAAQVSIAVAPANDAPVALDDAATTPQYTEVSIDVLANDSDVDGDPITVTSVTQPAHGTATLQADGSITYAPDPSFKGADEFAYTIADPSGAQATATVRIAEAACGEDGLQALDGTPLEGNLSRTIDRDVEPVVAGHDPALASALHEANCEVVVGAENAADDLLS